MRIPVFQRVGGGSASVPPEAVGSEVGGLECPKCGLLLVDSPENRAYVEALASEEVAEEGASAPEGFSGETDALEVEEED